MPSVREVAEACGVSPQTVRRHYHRLYGSQQGATRVATGVATRCNTLLLSDDQASAIAHAISCGNNGSNPVATLQHLLQQGATPVATGVAASVADAQTVPLQVSELREELSAVKAERDGLRDQVELLREQLAKSEAREAVASEALERARQPWWRRLLSPAGR